MEGQVKQENGRDLFELLESDIGYPCNYVKNEAGPNDHIITTVDTLPGIAIKKDNALKLPYAAASRNTKLIESGSLKYSVFDYHDVALDWMQKYKNLKSGDILDGNSMHICVQEIYRICPGVYYTKYHSPKASKKCLPCIANPYLTFAHITKFYDRLFGCDNQDAFIRNYFNTLEKLELDPTRCGHGLLLPYIIIERKVNLDDDLRRMGFDMTKLENPLTKILSDKFGNCNRYTGVTTPVTYFGFTASVCTSKVKYGPGLAYTNKLLFGNQKIWMITPPRWYEKVKTQLQSAICELKLDSNDDLSKEFTNGCFLQHQSIMLGPLFYDTNSIPYSFVSQTSGEIILFASKSIYCGINVGLNGEEGVCLICADFHYTYNDGYTQCNCHCGSNLETNLELTTNNTVTVRDISADDDDPSFRTDNKNPRFIARKRDIDFLLDASEKMLKGANDLNLEFEVPITRRKYKPKQRNVKSYNCKYCDKGFVQSFTRDKHEEKNNCNKYGPCKVPGCTVKIITTKKNEQLHYESHTKEERANINIDKKK